MRLLSSRRAVAAAVALFVSGSAFAFLDPPVLLSPANRDTTQPDAPQLRWSAVVFAMGYDVQLAVDSTFSFVRQDLSVSASPSPAVVVGPLGYDSTYYWRVRTRDSSGTPGIWSPFWRFRTIRPTPAAPTLSGPLNNAVNVLLTDSLVWNAVALAETHRIQLSTSSAFTSTTVDTVVPVVFGNGKQVLRLPPLANKTSYYWRVNAQNAAGSSAWSAAWKFTTIVAIPTAPTLTAPASGGKSIVTNPTFSWGAVPDAATYRLQVATDIAFTSNVYDDSSLSTTSRQVTGLTNAATYFWRVRAKNAGGIGPFSEIRSFTTQLAQAQIVAPANAATNVTIQPVLDWLPVPGAVQYRVQVATATTFAPLTVNEITTADQLPTGPLTNNTKYYWRVSALGAAGDTSTYPTTAWNFTTIVDTPTVPVLLTPVDGAKSLPTSPTLTWADTGGTTFRLQIATDAAFTSLVFNDSTISSKTKQVIGLANNTTFYWRVSAKNVAATTPYSSVRTFSTQLAQVPIVFPATGAIGQPIDLLLAWQPVAGAGSYRIQVSTSTTFSPALVNASTPLDQYMLSGLANNTKYYWRVSAVNANGDTSTYPTTAWNFTTIVDTPSVPVLIAPAANARSLPLNPTLSWEATGAISYRLQVATDAGFTALLVNDSTITTKSKQITGLLNDRRYYWRVRAKNAAALSSFSEARSFTTLLPTVDVPVPATGVVNQTVRLQLSWQPVTGAEIYLVQVSPTLSPFSPSILNATTANASVNVSGLQYNTRYYWRVSARNANGDSSLFQSTPWNFKTKIPAPLLSSPPNGAKDLTVNPILAWNASAGAYRYRLQISEDPTFSGGPLFDDSTLSSTTLSRQVGPLGNSRTYYWRLNARDDLGTSTSEWSEVWGFTTKIDTPGVPTLLSPANDAQDIPVSTTLAWNPSAGAALYTLQLAYDSLFSQKVIDGPPVIGTSMAVGPLLNNTRYFWRVNALNGSGTATSAFSAPRSFRTIIALPDVPVTVSPPSGAVNQPQMVSVKWRRANSASTYRLEVSTDSRFEGTMVVDSAGIVDTAVVVGPLVNNAYYYWRVSSANALGNSAPSPVSSFSTVIAPAALLTPAADATNLSTPVTFSWSPVTGAASYRLQIATEPTFAARVVDDSLIAGTSRSISALSVSKKYYWRVLTSSATNGVSVSAVWNFTTTIYQPDVPTLAFPSHNATAQPVRLMLQWFSALGARSYRLQVGTHPSFSTGIVFDTPGLADTAQLLTTLQYSTIYYWRVMASNDVGSSDWSTVWAFTTAVPPPATPALALPLNGETGVSRPTLLVWRRAAGASSYTLKVLLANRSVVEQRSDMTDTTALLSSLAPGTQYLWRVYSQNTGGVDSSAEWSFTTVIDPPTPPVPASPADGSINLPTSVAVRWRSSPGATQYRLQFSTDPGFTTIVYNDSMITDTARLVGPLAGLTGYYWRVQARNAGGSSAFSPSWMLTTIIATPSLRSPADAAQHQPIAPVAVWSRVSGASQYKVQVATDPLFNDVVYQNVTPVDTFQVVTGLKGFGTYFWRVYAQNPGGSSTSPYSGYRYFTTMVDTPQVQSPADGATSQPTMARLTWRVTPFAQTYSVQVAGDPAFSVLFAQQRGINDTSVVLGPLPGQSRCYWRVKAHNQADSGEFSAPRSFTTTLSTPSLVAPDPGSIHQPITPSLKWTTVIGGSRYGVQVARDSLFVQKVYDDSLLVGDSVRIPPLTNAARYFWRVRAKSASGLEVSAFSEPWSFTTIIDTPAVPVLLLPANAIINLPTTTTLSWRGAVRAERYRLQLATDQTFLTPLIDDATITDTTRLIGPLSGLTKYYWRISAINIGGESPFSTAWSFTTAIPTPVPVGPLSGSSNLPVSVTIVWRTVQGAASYRLQLSTDSLFTTRVVDDSSIVDSSRTLPALLHATKYFWRVRAKNAAGTSMSGFSPVWSFTTIIDTPAVPVLVYPSPGTLNIPTTIRLRWRKAARADTYRLEVAADSLFDTLVAVDSALADTGRTLTGLANFSRYHWRVRATNIGGTTPFSTPAFFTTMLATPVLSAPANGSVVEPIQARYQWNAVPSAASYRLQVSVDSTFKTVVVDDSLIAGTQRVGPPLQNLTRYFWRVRAKNADGVTISGFSEPWSYTTIIDTPAVPQLSSPTDKSSGLSTLPVIRWRPAVRATRYSVVVSTDSLFGTIVYMDSTVTDTSRQIGPLVTLSRYWWRVSASNDGGTSPWSGAWSFFTIISTPILSAPADSAVMQPTTLTLRWASTPGASTYRLQLSTDSLFATSVVDDSTLTGTSREVSGLSVYTRYFWRVRAKNIRGVGEFSPRWSFTTIIVAPGSTAPSLPADGATGQPVLIVLRWRPVALAHGYLVQLSLDSPFSTVMLQDSTAGDTSLTVGPLQYLTRYYWRVRASNVVGAGPFSAIRSFSTIVEAPEMPVPLAPTSSSGGQPFFVKLVWSACARADRYHLQVSKNAAFDSLVVNDSSLVDTLLQVGPLDHSRTYYWRVRASNAGSTTPFTAAWSFSTLEPPTVYQLAQNYPNPFNPATTIRYELPEETDVVLGLYNMLGQRVRLIVNERQKPGRYEVVLDGGNLPTGAYMYRLQTPRWDAVRKLMVVR